MLPWQCLSNSAEPQLSPNLRVRGCRHIYLLLLLSHPYTIILTLVHHMVSYFFDFYSVTYNYMMGVTGVSHSPSTLLLRGLWLKYEKGISVGFSPLTHAPYPPDFASFRCAGLDSIYGKWVCTMRGIDYLTYWHLGTIWAPSRRPT
jgi:hypothetical protein